MYYYSQNGYADSIAIEKVRQVTTEDFEHSYFIVFTMTQGATRKFEYTSTVLRNTELKEIRDLLKPAVYRH